MARWRVRSSAMLGCVAALLWCTPARAADPVAESMFQEALALMDKGEFAEACKRLEASKGLEPRSGTVIVLGSCYEQTGRNASAWAEYKEASAMARAEGRAEYATKATELAEAVAPRVSKLRVDTSAVAGGPTVTVTLDGQPMLPGQLGVPFAIDAGKHTLTASAPGHTGWSTVVSIGPASDSHAVVVPPLQPEVPAGRPPPRPRPRSRAVVAPAADTTVVPTWTIVVGAAGAASAVAAVAFLVDQHAAAAEIEQRCGDGRNRCPPGYDFDSAYAREHRDFAFFVAFGATSLLGLGTAVGGFALANSSKSRASTAPWVSSEGAGMHLRGAF